MTSGIAISAFMPSIISSSIFSSRRVNSGADALAASNPLVGAMKMDIAGGQILNAAKGVSTIARESTSALASSITSAEESIKALSKGDKIINGFGKVLNFTADNINPIICATGAVKVLTADDKEEAFIKEGMGLGTMFLSEGLAKRVLDMPEFKNVDGKRVALKRTNSFKVSPFVERQAEAFKDFCETTTICNKSIKFLPGMLKGMGFVAASILGYQLGTAAAENIVANTKVA